MFLSVLALLLVASVEASRVQVHHAEVSESKAKWGASCDDLQTVFRNRLAVFQTFLHENPDLDAVSRASQVRVMMRTYGIIRPLRRARTCSWVVDGDSAEIEQARNIVQILLAGNPCTEAARSELEVGASAETAQDEVQSLQRAILVLSSENCEVDVTLETPEQTADDENIDVQLRDAEDDLQDAIDELEDSVSQEGALIQTDSNTGTRPSFMRRLGVAFVVLLLLLACVSLAALIGAWLAVALAATLASVPGVGGLGLLFAVGGAFAATFVPIAGGLGLAACGSQVLRHEEVQVVAGGLPA